MPRKAGDGAADGGGAAPGDDVEVVDFVKGTRVKVAGLKTFKKGTPVIPVGLASAGNLELNGKLCEVAGFDESRGRWVVDFGDGIGKKLLVEANLEIVEDGRTAGAEDSTKASDHVQTSEPASNALGKPLRWDGKDSDSEDDEEDDEDDEVVDVFSPDPDVRVRITGLTAGHAHLNGSVGIIQSFMEDKNRWCIVLDDGLGKKLFKTANLEAEFPPPPRPPRERKPRRPKTQALVAELEPASDGPSATDAPLERRAPAGGRVQPGAQVLLEGLPGHLAKRNGQIAVCEYCDYMSGCWTVTFGDGQVDKMRPEFMTVQAPTLRTGAYVRMQKLPITQKLNGKVGICEGKTVDGRWSVGLENGERVEGLEDEQMHVLDSYHAPNRGGDHVSDVFEQCLESGEISWLDC